jgi:hypothetical protein
LWFIAIGAPNVFDGDIGNIYNFFDYKVKSGGITCQSSPHFIYFWHEIRNEHQLLVVAGPIVRSLVFLLRYLKDAGSFEREPIFLKKSFGCPAKRPELKRYNLKRKIK